MKNGTKAVKERIGTQAGVNQCSPSPPSSNADGFVGPFIGALDARSFLGGIAAHSAMHTNPAVIYSAGLFLRQPAWRVMDRGISAPRQTGYLRHGS